MLKFTFSLLFFLLIFAVLVVFPFDIFLRNMNSLHKEKVRGLLNSKDSIQILILGNSHANYGVDPVQFDIYAYNLANLNQSLYFDKRLTLRHIDSLSNLRYVFINVDHHSLHTSSQGLWDIWSYYGNGINYKERIYLLEDLSPFLFGFKPKISLSLLRTSISNHLRYKNEKILDFKVENGINLRDSLINGFITFEGTNDKLFSESHYINRADYFSKLISSSDENQEIKNDLEDFIIILLSRGIQPILFSVPNYSEYRKFISRDDLFKYNADLSVISKKYDIEFWDHSDDPLFVRSDFYDCDHLNKTGAAKFSRILNLRLVEIEND